MLALARTLFMRHAIYEQLIAASLLSLSLSLSLSLDLTAV